MKKLKIVAYIAIIPIVLALMYASIPWWNAQIEQMQRANQFRKEFVTKCFAQRGHIINMSKSNISRMCVGPDGRILASY